MSVSNLPSPGDIPQIPSLEHRKLRKNLQVKDFFKTHEVLHYLSNDSIKENREQLKSDILSPEKKWCLLMKSTEKFLKELLILLTF